MHCFSLVFLYQNEISSFVIFLISFEKKWEKMKNAELLCSSTLSLFWKCTRLHFKTSCTMDCITCSRIYFSWKPFIVVAIAKLLFLFFEESRKIEINAFSSNCFLPQHDLPNQIQTNHYNNHGDNNKDDNSDGDYNDNNNADDNNDINDA